MHLPSGWGLGWLVIAAGLKSPIQVSSPRRELCFRFAQVVASLRPFSAPHKFCAAELNPLEGPKVRLLMRPSRRSVASGGSARRRPAQSRGAFEPSPESRVVRAFWPVEPVLTTEEALNQAASALRASLHATVRSNYDSPPSSAASSCDGLFEDAAVVDADVSLDEVDSPAAVSEWEGWIDWDRVQVSAMRLDG
jgi:hypothetical protein